MYKSELDANNQTKYQSYTLVGGKNYREVLFTLPSVSDNDLETYKAIDKEMGEIDFSMVKAWNEMDADGIPVQDWDRVGVERGLFSKEGVERIRFLRREKLVVEKRINDSKNLNQKTFLPTLA